MTPQQRYARSAKGQETRRAAQRRQRATNPEKARAKDRAWAQANPERIRDKQLRTRYGITLEQWRALFAAQGEACALCRTVEPGRRGWATDHCHASGRVRGVLCHRCNLMIGWLGDNAAGVQESTARILRYLVEPAYDASGKLIPWEPSP